MRISRQNTWKTKKTTTYIKVTSTQVVRVLEYDCLECVVVHTDVCCCGDEASVVILLCTYMRQPCHVYSRLPPSMIKMSSLSRLTASGGTYSKMSWRQGSSVA